MGQNKWRNSKKIHIWNRVRLSLRGNMIIVNQIIFSTVIHRPHLYYPKIYHKGNWKNNIKFPLEQKKIKPPKHLAQLSIWRDRLGILDIYTQLNYIKIKWIQRLSNPTNALWKDLMMYWLKLILNSEQGLPLLDKNRSLQVRY